MLSHTKEIFKTLASICFLVYTYALKVFNNIICTIISSCFAIYTNLLLKLIRLYIDLAVAIIAKIFLKSKKDKIPAITDRLLLQSAVECSNQIRSGKLKSEALVKAYVERIKTVQPHINAIVDQRFSEAILEAIEIDKRVQYELLNNEPLIQDLSIYDQPLIGVPFTCKDSISIKGLSSTAGLVERRGAKADADAVVVKLMRKSGAIPIAVTNVPQLLMWCNTHNKLYGRTNNPYDLSRIPGGSSGGEAALIASAASAIGVGSDIGGSIRQPAFCCGLFGHKPTPGIVSTDGMFPAMTAEQVPYFVFGPIVRYAEDISATLKVMSGGNQFKLKLDESVDLQTIKIYYMDDDRNAFHTPVRKEIKVAINQLVSHMVSKYGNQAIRAELKHLSQSTPIWLFSLKQANALNIDQALIWSSNGNSINLFAELIKCALNVSTNILPIVLLAILEKYILSNKLCADFGQKYVKYGRELKKELKQLLGSDGVLICPTFPEPAVKHYTTIPKITNTSYTGIFNILGVPVTQCPLGLNRNGLPIGIQVIASPFNDHLTIAVAQEIEKLFGGWVCPSKINC